MKLKSNKQIKNTHTKHANPYTHIQSKEKIK